MLFFFENTEVDIEGKSDGGDKNISKGRSATEQVQKNLTAIRDYILPDVKTAYDNLSKNLLAFEETTMALNRTMGGFADKSGELQRNLEGAYLENLKLGATFKDAAETAQGMAQEMGRMVNPSKEVLSNAIAFSKAASMTNTETGKMIVQFQEYGGDQKEAITTMSKLGVSARKSGLDAKSFTTEVAKNLKQASLYGFKGGIKDIEEMVKKTKLLGTSMEKLGIKGAAENLLDPEKAMETAANIQMIGGNIGALGDPFQLMYMGQKDMKKLTDEVLNMTKATFTFDKATGAFTQTTEDMYAMKAQAQALGISYDDAAQAAKELAKVDFIKSSTRLADKITDEDTQNLVAGLAQISKDGTVNIDLPGLDKKFSSLDEALDDQEFQDALIKYQEDAGKSDKDLALEQMSIAEKQLATENEIKNLLLFKLSDNERKKFVENQEEIRKKTDESLLNIAEAPAGKVAKTMDKANQATLMGVDLTVEAFKKLVEETDLDTKLKEGLDAMQKAEEVTWDKIKNVYNTTKEHISSLNFGDEGTAIDEEGGGESNNTNGGDELDISKKGGNSKQNEGDELDVSKRGKIGDNATINVGNNANINIGSETKKINDAFLPSGGAPIIFNEGQIYEALAKDEMMIGTGLSKIFEKGSEKTNFLSQMVSQSNNQKNEVSGKIDFGNITVKIDAAGVDTNVLAQTLNSKQFTSHIMEMVAKQKSFYTNQSTLEG